MDNKIVFKDENELIATERVLATFKSQKINESIDELVTEIFDFAKKIDDCLDKNGLSKYYLDRVSDISENDEVEIIDDIKNMDVKTVEYVEDLVKRINTRINLIKLSDKEFNELTSKYKLEDVDLFSELKNANLI